VALGKANAVITVVPYNMTYDGQAHTATGTALGVEGTAANLSSLLSLNNTTHTNAGSYKGDAWSFAGNDNYNAASGTVDDNIAQATSSVSVTFEAGPYVYRGAAFMATAQVNGTTVSVPVSYSGDCSNVTTANGCTATATYVGDANHAANTGTSSITIMKANAKITVTGYNVTYDGHVHTATGIALGVEGAPANLSSLLSLNNTSHTNAGSYKGDVWSFAGNNNYNAANGTVDENIVQVLPIITWSNPADIVSGTPLGATQLNATANVNGIFVYTPPASTVLNAGSGQTLSVTFTPSDAADYAPASASVSINVLNTATGTNVAAQAGDTSITFSNVTAPGMTNAMLINPSTAGQVPDSYVLDSTLAYDVTTTATFSGPVQVCFTVTAVTDPDVFSTLRVLHGENGILVDRTILAPDSPAADFSAKRVCARVDSLSPFAIARVTDITPPTILITAPRATAYALNQSVTASYSCTDSGSGVDSCKGTIDNGSGIDTSSAGQKTFTVTATDKTRNTATETVNYTVNKGDPTITWTNPADIVYGTALSSTQLNATSNLPGTFAYTPVSGTVLKAGAQALSVTFTPNDPKNYNTATRTVTINVNKATPVITWANPGDITTGTPLSSIQLNATASVAGSFVYTPAAGTVLKGGSGQTLSVTFTPTDTSDYTTATKSVLINVKASTSVSTPSSSLNPSTYGQAVTLTAAVTSSAGTPTGTVQFLDGTMSLGTVALSSGSASITTAGVSAGARSITAVYSGDANFAGSTSPPLAQTVNKASTTSAMTVSQAQQQYSDLVTLQATLTPASIAGQAPATGAIFSIGSQQLNTTPVPLTMVNGVPTAILSNYALLETVTGQLQPGIRSLSVTFTGVNANFTVSNVTKSFSITREDARTYYTGPTSLSTASSSVSTATIPLRATIKDITAVTGDPSWDSNPGNIGLAQVSFVNRATGATIGTATLAIVPNPNDPNDKTVATATYNWNVDIGTATSQTFTVGTVVTGYYTRNSTTENATITVSKAH